MFPPKRSLLSAVPTSVSPNHSSGVAVVCDSSNTNVPSPQIGFADKEAGFEDLSASFRSLYKSLFGSVSGALPSGQTDDQYYNGLLPPNGVSSTGYSIATATVMGRPCISIADTRQAPQFTSLMDSLKDIAEKNRWETLNPSQIQSLRESFKSGNHKNFGMDQDTFLEWSHSFDQFLSQLDSRIPMVVSANGLVHSSFQLSDRLPPPPPYSQHVTVSNTYVTNSRMNAPFVPSLRDSSSNHLQLQKTPLFRSAATDLFEEDDDDFDWSKLV